MREMILAKRRVNFAESISYYVQTITCSQGSVIERANVVDIQTQIRQATFAIAPFGCLVSKDPYFSSTSKSFGIMSLSGEFRIVGGEEKSTV